jgi:hypothetical protein
MSSCAYLDKGKCTSPRCEARGHKPSAGFCAQCRHYTRWRGLGDLIHWCVGFIPGRKVQQMQLPVAQGGCGGCAARRAALNQAVPFEKSQDSTQAP